MMININNATAQQPLAHSPVNSSAGNIFAVTATIPERLLRTLYSWQNWANDKPQSVSQSDMPFRDLGPSKGNQDIDYGKPIWRR